MSDSDAISKTVAAAANPATVPSFTGTLAEGVHVLGGMGNALTVETDVGVIQVDTGQSRKQATGMLAKLREITDAPIHAIAYSHGHLGYNNAVQTVPSNLVASMANFGPRSYFTAEGDERSAPKVEFQWVFAREQHAND